MPTRLAALLLLFLGSALADGAAKTPFGSTILPADTRTWHCQSGRTVVSFVPNAQSIELFVDGRIHRLMLLPATPAEKGVSTLHYSEVGVSSDQTFKQRRTGVGLDWVNNLQKPRNAGLGQVSQSRTGKRQVGPLDFCQQIRP